MHLTGFVPVSPTRPVGHCWLPAVTLTVAAKVGMLLTLTVLILHFVPPLFLVDATDHCILVGCLLHASMQKYVSIKMVQRNNYMGQSFFWNGETGAVCQQIQHFYGPEDVSVCSQNHAAIGSYSKTVQSSPHTHCFNFQYPLIYA